MTGPRGNRPQPQDDSSLEDTVADVELDEALDADLIADGVASDEAESADASGHWGGGAGGGGAGSASEALYQSRRVRPAAATARHGEGQDPEDDDYDPELGQTRLKVQGPGVMDAVRSDTGLVIIAGVFGLIGIAVGIYAGINHSQTNLIIGGIVTPVALGISIWRWREWLGRHPYLYRLLMTVGEDDDAKKVLDQHRAKQQERVEKKMQKIRERYGAED